MTVAARKSPPFQKRFAQLLRDFADEVDGASLPVDDADPWVHQDDSPLGKEKHLQLAKDGSLPAFKPDRIRVLIRRSDIDKYIEKHPVKVRARPVAYTGAAISGPRDAVDLEAEICRELGVVNRRA